MHCVAVRHSSLLWTSAWCRLRECFHRCGAFDHFTWSSSADGVRPVVIDPSLWFKWIWMRSWSGLVLVQVTWWNLFCYVGYSEIKHIKYSCVFDMQLQRPASPSIIFFTWCVFVLFFQFYSWKHILPIQKHSLALDKKVQVLVDHHLRNVWQPSLTSQTAPGRRVKTSRMAVMLIKFCFKAAPGYMCMRGKRKQINGTQAGQTTWSKRTGPG